MLFFLFFLVFKNSYFFNLFLATYTLSTMLVYELGIIRYGSQISIWMKIIRVHRMVIVVQVLLYMLRIFNLSWESPEGDTTVQLII